MSNSLVTCLRWRLAVAVVMRPKPYPPLLLHTFFEMQLEKSKVTHDFVNLKTLCFEIGTLRTKASLNSAPKQRFHRGGSMCSKTITH